VAAALPAMAVGPSPLHKGQIVPGQSRKQRVTLPGPGLTLLNRSGAAAEARRGGGWGRLLGLVPPALASPLGGAGRGHGDILRR